MVYPFKLAFFSTSILIDSTVFSQQFSQKSLPRALICEIRSVAFHDIPCLLPWFHISTIFNCFQMVYLFKLAFFSTRIFIDSTVFSQQFSLTNATMKEAVIWEYITNYLSLKKEVALDNFYSFIARIDPIVFIHILSYTSLSQSLSLSLNLSLSFNFSPPSQSFFSSLSIFVPPLNLSPPLFQFFSPLPQSLSPSLSISTPFHFSPLLSPTVADDWNLQNKIY